MKDCAIPFKKGGKLRKDFNKDNNYESIANSFLNSAGEGYFLDLNAAASKIGEGDTLFDAANFKSIVKTIHSNNRVEAGVNDYFLRDINSLFENANDPMSYMYNGMEQDLIKAAFIDTEAGTLTIDNSDLNGKIQEYKNSLFKKAFDYVKKNNIEKYIDSEFVPLYVNKRYQDDSNYSEILNDLAELFEAKKYDLSKVSIYNKNELAVLEVFNAGVILSNFDTLVENRFNNIVTVNQTNFNNLETPLDNLQYFLEFKGLETTYWKDNSHDSDGIENYASNFMKVLSSTIPLRDINGEIKPNMYLGMNGISLIGTLVKELNNEDFSNNNFQQDPKKELRSFMTKLKNSGRQTYQAKVLSLEKYLRAVRKITKDKMALNPDLNDIIDIEAVIAHQINNTTAPTYGIVEIGEDKKMINLVQRDLQGDEPKKQMIDAILQSKNLYNNVTVKDGVVTALLNGKPIIVNETSSPDSAIKRLLKDLTGLDITKDFINILNKTINSKGDAQYLGKAFADLLIAGKEIITLDASRPKPEALLDVLNQSTRIVDLVTASISVLNPEANMTFKSSQGNAIPTVKISNIAHEKKTVINLAQEHFGGVSTLFTANPNLYKGTETILEVIKDGKAISALEMNPEEGFFFSFVESYLKPMQMTKEDLAQSGAYPSFKLVNYSDKSTVFHEMIDPDLNIGEGSLREMSLNKLKETHRQYLHNYYGNIVNKVSTNYARLELPNGELAIPGLQADIKAKKHQKVIKKINEFLASGQLKPAIKHTWKKLNKQGVSVEDNISFTDEVSFSKYGKGLEFNRTIEHYFYGTMSEGKIPKEYRNLNDLSEELFVNKLVEIAPNITNPATFFNGKTGKNYISGVYKNLGLDIGTWISFENDRMTDFVYFKYKNKDGNLMYAKDMNDASVFEGMSDVEVNPLLAKWLHTQNLIRYNSLALSTKHEYQHPHKQKGDFDFNKEMSGRSVSMTKRMVIHPATMEYYMQGLYNGIPPKINIAFMDDFPAGAYNFSGDEAFLDGHDGSLYSNPFLTFLLKNSFPAKGISDVQKMIGTSATDTHSIFLKCALFTFNNELIRKSGGSKINLDNIMRAMNNIDISDMDISINSKSNDLFDFEQLAPEGIYLNEGGTDWKFDHFKKLDNGEYQITLIDNDQGGTRVYNKPINNLYDLWTIFGGAYSKTNMGGNLEYSDASIDAVGSIISLVGGGELKNKMIGILSQKQSVKNGATNINASSEFTSENPSLMYTTMDTNFMGIQLDANHASDHSVINEISQVISALAENQSTPELYSQLYGAIGSIISGEIDNYNKKFGSKEEGIQFDKEKLTKDFINVLSKKEQTNNSMEIVDLLEKVSRKSLPISNHNFFGGFVINVVSRLKSDFIKRKYPGIAAVLNPSYNIVQLYEDDNGNTYFHDDLLDLAENSDKPAFRLADMMSQKQEIELINGDTSDLDAEIKRLVKIESNINHLNGEIVKNVVSRLFPNKQLTQEQYGEIKPLDIVNVTEDGVTTEWNLTRIQDYYKLKNKLKTATEGISVEIVKNKPRDLKPVEISYTQNGVQQNIFDSDPVRLNWTYESLLKGEDVPADDFVILENFANFFQADLKKNKDLIKSKLKLWTKRSFELLSEGKMYKPANENTNFAQLFGDDTMLSKIPENFTGLVDPIENYTHKPAEVVMPKVYRSEFEIGHQSFDKIQSQKEGYFASKLQSVINPKITDVDMYVSSTDGNHTYISILTEEQIKEKALVKKKITTKEIDGDIWRVGDLKGEKLYKMPSDADIYTDGNYEIVVFTDNRNVFKSMNSFVSQIDSYFAHTFAANNPDLSADFIRISDKKNPSALKGLVGPMADINNKVVDTLSKAMYTSWLKSNDMSVARIPSQAMQSFMSMKNVGYVEDDGNNVFVSHWQIWLQGSDFDIDKAYIMMLGFKKGVYEGWSPYFDITSYEGLTISENLPVPNKKNYEITEEMSEDVLDLSPFLGHDITLELVVELLNQVNQSGVDKIFKVEHPQFDELVDIIKTHNSYNYTQGSLKNFVVKNVINTSNHAKNQLSSYSPITFGKLEDIKAENENNFILSLMDGLSMDQQQETNSVGKDVIGVAANGIKDYFALMDYFSGHYDEDVNRSDNEYFERSITLKGEGSTRIVNRIAGQNISRKGTQLLNRYINEQLETINDKIVDKDGNIIESVLDPYADPAMALSSLLSAATDNAKELILKTINAGKDFAVMHVYLIILGFNEADIARFMTHEDIVDFMNTKMKSNIFIQGQDKKQNADKLVNSDITDPELDKKSESTPVLLEFKKIYNLSKELTSLAKVLKINQGLKASPEVLYTYFKNLENDFVSRELQFTKDNWDYVVKDNNLPSDSKPIDHVVEMVIRDKPYLRTYKAKIKESIRNAQLLGITEGGFSFEEYFTNPVYKKMAIDYYNLIKGTYNVLDVVDKLKHFQGMIQATKMSYDTIKSVSKKFIFMTETVPEILSKSNLTTVPFKIYGTNKVSLNTLQLEKAKETFDDLVISKWFKAYIGLDPTFKFDLKDVETLTGESVRYYEKGGLNDLGNDSKVIDFTTDEMLVNFKTVMESNLLPYLKKNYPDNQFINGLILRQSTDKKRSWISTKVRMNRLMDSKNLDVLFNYQKDLNKLFEDGVEIRLGDKSFNVADMFFMYNLIVNKDRFGSDRLTKLMGGYVSSPNSLSKSFYEMYSRIDANEEELFDELFPLDDNMLKIIEFGVLNTRGRLETTKATQTEEAEVSTLPPNYTLVTSLDNIAPNYENVSAYRKILNGINDKNLLIEYNCNG